MKTKLLTMLFALVALAGQAQKQVVWEKPRPLWEIVTVSLKSPRWN